MTALERATRTLVRIARRWRLARLEQSGLDEALAADWLLDAIDRQEQTELRAVTRRCRERKKRNTYQ